MQQVQNCLDFPIDTPSDKEISEKFSSENSYGEMFKKLEKIKRQIVPKKPNGLTKNQRKRARKAQKKSKQLSPLL